MLVLALLSGFSQTAAFVAALTTVITWV